MTLAEIDVFLPPARSAAFTDALTLELGIESSKVCAGDTSGGDLFTSSLADVFRRARLEPGKIALFVEVGSGIQVACALYRA